MNHSGIEWELTPRIKQEMPGVILGMNWSLGGDDDSRVGRGCQREIRSGGGSRQSATQWVRVRVKENDSWERGCWASWVELGWVGLGSFPFFLYCFVFLFLFLIFCFDFV